MSCIDDIQKVRTGIIDRLIDNAQIQIIIPKQKNKSKLDIICDYFKKIEDCNIHIIIPKPDLSLGETTLCEYAFSKYIGVNNIVFNPNGGDMDALVKHILRPNSNPKPSVEINV